MKKLSFLFVLFVATCFANLPVDISFLVADLKYNEDQGVKICEIQPSSLSVFEGLDYLCEEKGVMGDRFCQVLSHYHNTFWFIEKDVNYKPMIARFKENQWIGVESLKILFPISQPQSIESYKGVMYAAKSDHINNFKKTFPGLIVINEAIWPYWGSKHKMSQLFTGHQTLEKIKPRWKLYPKKYSPELAEKIIDDIGSELFVIKPSCASEGRGVIIVSKEDLDQTLHDILQQKDLFKDHPDTSYKYWAYNRESSFLVEEYVSSDPIYVPHLSNLPYNGTMRVVFVLIHQHGVSEIHFLGEYWILPRKSILESGDLNERKKSYPHSPYYCAVDPDVFKKVKKQLGEAMLLMYEKIITDTFSPDHALDSHPKREKV